MFVFLFAFLYIISNMYKILTNVVFLIVYLYLASLSMIWSVFDWNTVKIYMNQPILTYKYLYDFMMAFYKANLGSLHGININKFKVILPMLYTLIVMQLLPFAFRFIPRFIFRILTRIWPRRFNRKNKKNTTDLSLQDDLKALIQLRIQSLKQNLQKKQTLYNNNKSNNVNSINIKPAIKKPTIKTSNTPRRNANKSPGMISYNTVGKFINNNFNITSKKIKNKKQ